jgi:hypothetical protein
MPALGVLNTARTSAGTGDGAGLAANGETGVRLVTAVGGVECGEEVLAQHVDGAR